MIIRPSSSVKVLSSLPWGEDHSSPIRSQVGPFAKGTGQSSSPGNDAYPPNSLVEGATVLSSLDTDKIVTSGDPSVVDSWEDGQSGYVFVGEGDGGTQPTWNPGDVHPVGLDDDDDTRLIVDDIEGSWDFVHQGTGATCVVALRSDNNGGVFGGGLITNVSSTSGRGFRILTTSGSGGYRIRAEVGNGSTGVYAINEVVTPIGEPSFAIIRYGDDKIRVRVLSASGSGESETNFASWSGLAGPSRAVVGSQAYSTPRSSLTGGLSIAAVIPGLWTDEECTSAEDWAVSSGLITL